MSKLDDLSGLFLEAKATEEAAAKAFGEAEQLLVDAIGSAGLESYDHTDAAGMVTRLTPVHGETSKRDEEKIEEKLPKGQWLLITKRRIDTKALNGALELGKVSADIIRRYTTSRPKKAYVSVTENPKSVAKAS